MSKEITNHITRFIKENSIKVIFSYYPYKKEPDIRSLYEKTLSFALPFIQDKNKMEFYSWNKEETLKNNRYKIKEPLESHEKRREATTDTLFLIPSLGASEKGERLGYGGGFYDRYFSENPLGIKMGCCFSSDILQSLESQEHDFPLDYLVTEKGLQKF